jgi:hypothetical protein
MSACGGSYSREIRRHFFINGPQWTAAYGGQVLFLASGTSTATCGPSGAPRSNSSSALGLCTKDSRLAQSRSSLSLISKVLRCPLSTSSGLFSARHALPKSISNTSARLWTCESQERYPIPDTSDVLSAVIRTNIPVLTSHFCIKDHAPARAR